MTDEQIWELFAEHTKKGTTAASVLTFARALLAVPGAEQAPIGYVIEMMIERLPNEHQTVLYDRPCGSATMPLYAVPVDAQKRITMEDFQTWFKAEWTVFQDKAWVDMIPSKAWALKAWKKFNGGQDLK